MDKNLMKKIVVVQTMALSVTALVVSIIALILKLR